MNYDHLKQEEGLRLKAYRCQAGVPTIGYGSTIHPDGRKVQMGDAITLEQAEVYLRTDAARKWNAVKHAFHVPLNENQIMAIVSLIYNIGVGGFLGSTLLRRINAKAEQAAITEAFAMWNKITVVKDGKPVKIISSGLASRRAREAALYFS